MTFLSVCGATMSTAEKTLQGVLEGDSIEPPDVSNSALETGVAPCIAQAKASLAEARVKYEKESAAGSLLLLFRRLPSEDGSWELELHLAEAFSGSQVQSHQWMGTVQKSRGSEKVSFPVTEVVDWVLAHSNGKIEGNRIAACLKNLKNG